MPLIQIHFRRIIRPVSWSSDHHKSIYQYQGSQGPFSVAIVSDTCAIDPAVVLVRFQTFDLLGYVSKVRGDEVVFAFACVVCHAISPVVVLRVRVAVTVAEAEIFLN